MSQTKQPITPLSWWSRDALEAAIRAQTVLSSPSLFGPPDDVILVALLDDGRGQFQIHRPGEALHGAPFSMTLDHVEGPSSATGATPRDDGEDAPRGWAFAET